jgi:hypothetical protein
MRHRIRIVALIIIMLLASCAPEATPVPAASATPLPVETKAPLPSATDTAVPPTPTATETTEPTATFTLTPEPAIFTVEQNAICRTGPSGDYSIVTYLNPGTAGTIDGRNQDGTWWYVHLQNSEEGCWLSDQVVTTNGGLDALAYVEPPPAPPTTTPTPPLVIYYLVLVDSGGAMKCGDSLYPVSTGKYRTGDLSQDIKIALNGLFKNRDKYTGELYNALYKSRLSVDDVVIDKVTGWVEVFTVGNIDPKGDDCDRSRISDQIWQTVLQFPEIPHADIRWNGGPIQDRLYSP